MLTREAQGKQLNRIEKNPAKVNLNISCCFNMRIFLFFLFFMPHSLFAATLAVSNFYNLSNSQHLLPLEKSIPAILTTDLSNVDELRIVERREIEQIVGEQKFSLSGLVDERGEKEVGKLLGVDFILTGSYAVYNKQLRVDVKMTNISTGVISGFSQMGTDENLIHQLSEKIVKRLLDKELVLTINEPLLIIPDKPAKTQPWYKKWYTWAIIGTVIAAVAVSVSKSSSGGDGGDGGSGGFKFSW